MATTTVNIHDAKTQLSKLIERAERGEEVVIARAGKPVVMLARLKPKTAKVKKRELGFLSAHNFKIPDDFDEMGREEIEKMFYGEE
jgi:prevent-host-death family protein